MRVALLGANGQLGSDIVKTKPEKLELISLTRKAVDVRDKERLRQILLDLKADTVINTTGYVRVDNAEDEVEEAFKVNAIALKAMAEICDEMNSVLLHLSTDYIFDGKKEPEPYIEEDTASPINTYGISKYAGEFFVRNYSEKHYIARSASLYGKSGASGKGGNFVYTILKKAKGGEALRVIDDIFMSPTYTLDAAKEIWKLILEERPFGVYHVTNSGYCSWYEFAKKILEFSGLKNEIIPVSHTEYKTKAKRPLWSPLRSVKGINMRRWEEALEEFLAT